MQEPELMKARCACGWEAIGAEDEVVDVTLRHGEEVHSMRATREQVRASLGPASAAGDADATGTG